MYRHQRHSVVAAFLVAVWAITPVLSVIHAALDAHTYCAEHGVLEEGDTHHVATAASRGQQESRSPLLIGPNQPDAPEQDPHSACAFDDVATRDVTPWCAAMAVVAAPSAHVTAAPARHHVGQSSLRLLLAAPKTSPPAPV